MGAQMKIFKNEVIPISLEEINMYTFDDFKTKGYLLNSDYEEIIMKFYNKVYINEFTIPFYHCLPTLNSLTNEKKFKFMIVQSGNDSIFVVYKVIQIIKTKQIRFFDIPISLNDIAENQYKLIENLSKKNFVRFCYSSPFISWFNAAYANRCGEYDNYCKNREWFTTNCNKRWQRVRGVRDVLKNDDFRVVLSHVMVIEDARNVRKNFNKYIENRGGKVSKADDDEFYNIVKNARHNDKIVFLSMYYKDEIIGVRILFIIRELGVAYGLYNIHIRQDKYEDRALEKVLKFEFIQNMDFFVFDKIPYIKRLYVLGYTPSEKRLAKHKANIYKDCLKYYLN